MKINCDVILDLIPLVNDNVASEKSEMLVNEHCKQCESCANQLNVKPQMNQKMSFKLKGKIQLYYIGLIFLVLLLFLSINNYNSVIDNIILIPLVGAISYHLLKKDNKIVYLVILIIHLFLLIITRINYNDAIVFTIIYWILLSIGMFIYRLFKYSFTKEKKMIVKRILIFIVAVTISFNIIWIYTDLKGNPIIRITSRKQMVKYIEKNYSHLDYELGSVSFNFKDDSYYINVDVIDSYDYDFTVMFSDNQISDDYQYLVNEGWNTETRLQVYLNFEFDDLIEGIFDDNYDWHSLRYDESEYLNNKPVLDTPMDVLLETYSFDLTIYVHNLSKYSENALNDYEEKIKEEFSKFNMNIKTIEFYE